MYSCYLHNWYSHHYSCPMCLNIKTTTDSSVIEADRRYNLHDKILEIQELETSNKQLSEALASVQKKLEIAREALKLRHKLPTIESDTTVGSFLSTINELWKKQDEALKQIEDK